MCGDSFWQESHWLYNICTKSACYAFCNRTSSSASSCCLRIQCLPGLLRGYQPWSDNGVCPQVPQAMFGCVFLSLQVRKTRFQGDGVCNGVKTSDQIMGEWRCFEYMPRISPTSHQLQRGFSDVSRLEVLKDGRWIPIFPRNDSFYINMADIMQVLTSYQNKSIQRPAVAPRTGPSLFRAILRHPCEVCKPNSGPWAGGLATSTCVDHLLGLTMWRLRRSRFAVDFSNDTKFLQKFPEPLTLLEFDGADKQLGECFSQKVQKTHLDVTRFLTMLG